MSSGWTYGPGFGSGGSQAAVSYIMTLEGSSIVIQFFKVHHFLHLERQNHAKMLFKITSPQRILGQKLNGRDTNQVFVLLLLKGERPPSNESDPGEEVSLQHLSEQQLPRLARSAEDETAFVLMPEIFLQGLHVPCHAVCHNHFPLIPFQVILSTINTVLVKPLSFFTNFT